MSATGAKAAQAGVSDDIPGLQEAGIRRAPHMWGGPREAG
jgi:hypothetical protein